MEIAFFLTLGLVMILSVGFKAVLSGILWVLCSPLGILVLLFLFLPERRRYRSAGRY